MMKDFRKKTKNLIKLLVRQNNLKLYTLKISLGECSETDFETICNLLLEIWRKMYVNHTSIFFSHFEGFTRELIIEIDGEVCRPFLFFVLFASNKKLQLLSKLKNLALFSVFKALKILDSKSVISMKDFDNVIVPLEEVPEEHYEKVLDDLMKPCIRVINHNEKLEELLEVYQYNRQLCSRGGIVSKRNLERNVSLEIGR